MARRLGPVAVGFVRGEVAVLHAGGHEVVLRDRAGGPLTRAAIPDGLGFREASFALGRWLLCVFSNRDNDGREVRVWDAVEGEWTMDVAFEGGPGIIGTWPGQPVVFVGHGREVMRLDLAARSTRVMRLGPTYCEVVCARASDGLIAGASEWEVWRWDGSRRISIDADTAPQQVTLGAWLDEERLVFGGMESHLLVYDAFEPARRRRVPVRDLVDLLDLVVLVPGEVVAVRAWTTVERVWLESGRVDVFRDVPALGQDPEDPSTLWLVDEDGPRGVPLG